MRIARLTPPRVLTIGFLSLIALGTLLLLLPAAVEDGHELTVVDAVFTATSAVCVTGLIVVDTPVAFTTFGEIVLLLLIQLGGLGYMTVTTLVAVSLGRELSLQERLVLQETLQTGTLDQITRFGLTVLKLTLIVELTGAAVLTLCWLEHGWGRAAYLGLFHAVSAFNNAGFSLFSTNLMAFRDDPAVNLVIAALVVAGGLGYLVLIQSGRPRRLGLSLHTKLVLTLTLVLLASGTLAVFLLERTNPATLAGLPADRAWLAAFFQAMTPRTAGFNTVEIGSLYPATQFVVMALMFVGGAPGGTAGGVKITTVAITVLAMWATARGRVESTVLRHRLPAELVAQAFFICLIGFLTVNIAGGLLLILEGRAFLPTMFETVSAFGTVGLSLGQADSPLSLASFLSGAGKTLLVVLMFIGRVGPLTVAVALAGRRAHPDLRYPEGKVLIG